MLTVIYAESADNLAHLIRFYAPTADRLLDITYGGGTLSSRSPIPVTGIDIDRGSKAHIIADITLPLPVEKGSFEIAVYDPPYLYGSKAMHMGPVGMKTWQPERSTWKTPVDLIHLTNGAASNLYPVMKPNGCTVVKIMDSRFKGRLILNHRLVTDAFEANNWRLVDQIVYIRTVTGSFVNKKSAQCAHGYFLIFR